MTSFLKPDMPPKEILSEWSSISGCHDTLEVHGFKINSGFGGQLYLRTTVVVDACFQSDDIADTLNYVPLLQVLKNLSLQQGDPVVLLKMFEKLCLTAPYVVGAHAWTTHHREPRPSACDLPLASYDDLSCFTINVVLGCGEMERYKTQPLTIRIHFDVEALPHLHRGSIEAMRESVSREVEREQCYTIERVAGLVLDTVGSTFAHAQVIKVVVEKPEIGFLTNHDMEFASFSMVRRRLRDQPINATDGTAKQIPLPHVAVFPSKASLLSTLPTSTSLIAQERQSSAEAAAQNFRALSRASTEYDFIQSRMMALLASTVSVAKSAAQSAAGAHQHGAPTVVRVLDVGCGYGWLLESCLRPFIQDGDQPTVQFAYTAFEPNAHFQQGIEQRAHAIGLTKDSGSFMLHTTKFTPQSLTLNGAKFDLVLFCHSLYEDKDIACELVRHALSLLTLHGRCMVVHAARRLFDILPSLDDRLGKEGELVDAAVDTSAHIIVPAERLAARAVVCAYYGIDVLDADVCSTDILYDRFGGKTFHAPVGTLVWQRRNSNGAADEARWRCASPIDDLMQRLSPDKLLLPDSSSYVGVLGAIKNKSARRNYPVAIALPSCEDDVVECVRWCMRYGHGFTVGGGGHSEHCTADKELLISLSRMRRVDLDRERSRITCGGGCVIDDIVSVLDPQSLMVPLGSRPSVGMGLALHGGLGHYTRSLGFSSDFVVCATLVLPSAEVLTLSSAGSDSATTAQCRHDDIFQSLRGAGSMLGIVVQVTFQCIPFQALSIQRRPLSGLDDYFSKSMQVPSRSCSLDAYVTAPSQPVASSLQLFSMDGVVLDDWSPDVPAPFVTSTYRELFEAELHREFPKANEDFKRTVLVPKRWKDMAVDVLSAAMRASPTSKCYLHIMQCGPPPTPHISLAGHCVGSEGRNVGAAPRDWEWAVVITARWDGGEEEASLCRQWVYSILDGLPGCLVYATDLGHGAQDSLYGWRAFETEQYRQVARLRRNLDESLLLANGRTLLFPSHSSLAVSSKESPSLVIAICGKRYAGKDAVAGYLKELLEAKSAELQVAQWHHHHDHHHREQLPLIGAIPASTPITVRVVSISDAFKKDWCERNNEDFIRMGNDRAYKERLRPAMNAEAECMTPQQNIAALQYCMLSCSREPGQSCADVVIITGMREPNLPDVLGSCGVPTLRVLVEARDDIRARRGWVENAQDRHPRETSIDKIDSWDSVLSNNHDGWETSIRPGLLAYVVPTALQQCGVLNSSCDPHGVEPPLFAEAKHLLRHVENFPFPGIDFKDVIGLASARGCNRSLLLPRICEWMAQVVRQKHPRCGAIITVESGGCIWASPVAMLLGLPLVVVRKRSASSSTAKEPPPSQILVHGGSNASRRATMLELRCGAVPPNTTVVLIDDVYASGSTAECVDEIVASNRSTLEGIVCVGRFPLCEDEWARRHSAKQRLSDRVDVHALMHFPCT